jgi:azurin
MNTHFLRNSAQRLHQPAHTARIVCTYLLAALGLLALLAACATPGAAQQTVVKAVAREKPISDTATPAPTAQPTPTATPAPIATPAPTATPAPSGQPVSIGTKGGEWQFDTDTLEVAAGQDIVLTFHNNAKTTAHNWVLVSGGDDVATAVNTAGEQAGEAAGYISDDARIIARTTGLVKGGQTESVAFTAPAAGTYTYLCTFPGHLELGMKGVLTVK